jgi:hypothetical protein
MPTVNTKETQRGASLLAAIFLIVVVGFFGLIVVSLVSTQNIGSLNEIQSTQAFYVAEAGMEQAVSYLLGPTLAPRTTCAGLPGAATSLNPGQFQLNTEAGSPFYSTTATTIPAGGVTSVATTIPVVSTANYAPFGRIMIDRELIDYTGTTAISFTGALRGRDGTLATSHLAGTRVGQSQCTVTSRGGVIDLTATARGRRVQRAGIQLQEAWAVGDNGEILRWNGMTWVLFAATGVPLNGVAMDSYGNGWAVGDVAGGVAQARRWVPDGTPAWDPSAPALPAQASQRLNAIQSVSWGQAWAVGDSGGGGGGTCTNNRARILRWNGAWACVASPSDRNLNAVFMLDANNDGAIDDGWAVGDSGGGGAGLCTNARILRWDGAGAAWNCVASPSSRDLNGVFMVSANDGWAVGDSGGGGAGLCTNARILRWDGAGAAWNCVASPSNRNLNGVFMVSANDGWAVGDSGGGGAGLCTNARILRWNGAAWNCVASPINQDLKAVACATANDCWAVGNAGAIIHWDGNSWTVHPQSGVVTNRILRSIHIVGPRGRPQAMWREVIS